MTTTVTTGAEHDGVFIAMVHCTDECLVLHAAERSIGSKHWRHSNRACGKILGETGDRPIDGLLAGLKARGLLDDTLVWRGCELGRTLYAEKKGTGRDYKPGGFTIWLAIGGVKAGLALEATDELGHLAVEGEAHLHDLHATTLHLFGLDHERLTTRYSGRDFRMTDMIGRAVGEIIV